MLEANRYDPVDWYWLRADGTLFGSLRLATVADDDQDFQAWSSRGLRPSTYPKDVAGEDSVAALQDVLTPYGINVPNAPSDLPAYAAMKRYAVETGGIMVGGAPIATDRESQALINGAFNLAQAKPDTVFKFKAGGGFVDLDSAAIQIIAIAVGEHVQACFAKEAEVVAAITAEPPTVTTAAQVDTAFASLV